MVKEKDQAPLAEIGRHEQFCFACGPHVPCFGLCCAELALPVTPYDALRLRRHLEISGEDLVRGYLEMRFLDDCGLPLPFLKMLPAPGEPCPFVFPGGCAVYENRPGACRIYPLGRGSKPDAGGVAERFFMVREEHCHGFDAGPAYTPAAWLVSQNLERYTYFNDRFMRLCAMLTASGAPLEEKFAGMAVLALYQLDKFRQLIGKMDIFRHVEISPKQARLLMLDSPAGDEAALNFSFDWLELIIFGSAASLVKKEL